MKILYLYSELMGYQIPVFKEYINRFNAEVHVVHWDHKKMTPYEPEAYEGIHYYHRSAFGKKELKSFVLELNPDITYVSGWMDKGYLYAIRKLRKLEKPVVTGFDDIWFSTLKQRLASLIFPFFKKTFYSHAWVAGPYQFEYAKRLGFAANEIIFNCLTADISLFNEVYEDTLEVKQEKYPHKFLYVGRFEKIKGTDLLAKAWKNLKEKGVTKDWDLTLIGNGTLEEELRKYEDIISIKGFLSPEKLAEEIKAYGCFVLPSRAEAWSLVIHEFAAGGYPILCSNICGAAPVFVIENYNGFTFNVNDIPDLESKMLKIINSSDKELIEISQRSHQMGQKINPTVAASSFMSVLNN